MNEKFKNEIADLLPNGISSSVTDVFSSTSHENLLQEYSDNKQTKLNAKEIAKAKMREQKYIDRLEAKINNPTELMTPSQKARYEEKQKSLKEAKDNVDMLESIDVSKPVIKVPEQALPLIGATRPEVAKLLQSLNVNVNINLTKSDTYNLLGCLLTCNENQLKALLSNPKIPIAIKTVVKRLLMDADAGSLGTIESLWDRIFGKQMQTTLDMPTSSQQVMGGIIPNTVISREAYVVIRDTVIGKE